MLKRILAFLILPALLLAQAPRVTVTTRQSLGAPLSFTQADKNFTDLQAAANASLRAWGQKESTTTGLTYGYYGGPAFNGTTWTSVGDGTVVLTASSTNYVERTSAGVVSSNLIGWTSGKTPMALITTGVSAITTVTDFRGGPTPADLAAPTGAGMVGLDDNLAFASGTLGAKAQYSQTASAQMQAMLSKIKRNVEDVTILILGDSTGDGADRWPNQLALQLPAMFPTHTIKYTTWNSTVYNALTTIATGTGAQTITVYNGSISGGRTFTPLGGRWAAMVAGIPSPDVTFLNYGHNQGTIQAAWKADYLTLTESVLDTCPGSGIVLILQNPSSSNTDQAKRNAVYEQMATQRGFGTINVWQAFIDYGPTWTTDLMADTVHPNAAGSLLWTAQIVTAMKFSRYNAPKPVAASLVNQAGRQLIINGDFSQWTGTAPDGWVAYNGSPTISKDTVNFENPNGYGLKVVATGGTQCSVAASIPYAGLKGKWVTILARVYVPVGAPSTAGMVGVNDGVLTTTSADNGTGSDPGGAFKWVVVSKKFSASATNGLLLFYGDQGATNSNATLDHISVVVGDTPYGLPRMLTNQPNYTPSLGAAASPQFQTQVNGQAYPSYFQTADGAMYFGPGTSAATTKGWYYSGGNIKSDFGVIATGASQILNTLSLSYTLTTVRGRVIAVTAVSGNTTLDSNYHTVNYTGAGGHTITLPTVTGNVGRVFIIKNTGAGSLTVSRAGSDTIDGATTLTLTTKQCVTLVADTATTWLVVDFKV